MPQVQTSVSHFAIVGSEAIEWTEPPRAFQKYYASMRVKHDEACFILGFGRKGPDELLTRLASRLKLPNQGMSGSACASPEIEYPDSVITSFLMNCGEILDSIKVKDMPGGCGLLIPVIGFGDGTAWYMPMLSAY